MTTALTRSLFASAIVGSSILLASPARSADPAQDLFDRGVAHLEAGRFAEACPAIEQSYRIDPRPGTLFTLAVCEEKRGRLATALRRYDEYLAQYLTLPPDKKAKQGDREQVSRAARASLASRVPELTLVLPPDAPSGTQVTRDGVVVESPALGTPVLVDPGDHEVITRAPSNVPSTARIPLAVGERRRVVLVMGPLVPDPTALPPPQTGSRWRLYTGGTLVGVGVAALVTGIVGSTQILSAQSAIDRVRTATPKPASFDWCDPAPASIASACNKARTATLMEAVAYPLAAATVGVGIFLLVPGSAASKPPASGLWVTPSVGPRFTGLSATGRF